MRAWRSSPSPTPGGRLLADRLQERRDRLADLLESLPAEDEPALGLAMHVALPIVQRLIDNAAQAVIPTGPARAERRDGNEPERTAQPVGRHDDTRRETREP